MQLRNLFEQDELRTIVFTFGRFNPPTIGHEVLINQVKSVAQKYGADYIIFASQSQDKKKNPLTYAEKIFFMEQMFPGTNFNKDTSIKTPFQALEELGKDYDRAVLVVGSDRVPEFKQRMAPYVEEFGYKELQVVSAGERDPDAEGAEGMSASKARELAVAGDIDQFKQAIPSNDRLAQMMYDRVRAGLGILDKEPAMSESSIASKINWPGAEKKDKKEKEKDKEKPSLYAKLKKAVGLGEGEVVIDPTQLRKYLRMLIDDAIDKEQDIEKLSKVLKMLVGKEIKSRGRRYSITGEDIASAIKEYQQGSSVKALADDEFNKIVAQLAHAGIPLTRELNQWRSEGGLVNVIRNLIPFINKKFDKMKSYDIDRYFKSADFNSKTPEEKKRLVPALLNIKKAQEVIPEIITQLRIIQKDLEDAGITEAEQQSMPAKVKPLAVPKFPPMPEQDGDLGNGVLAGTSKKTGDRYQKGAEGTFVWDKTGNPKTYVSPSMAGAYQIHDVKTGNFTQKYANGGLKISGRYDKEGNSLDKGDAEYKLGDVKMTKNADGSSQKVYTAGTYRLTVTKDANGKETETYTQMQNAQKGVTVDPDKVPTDIKAALAQTRARG